MPRDQCGDYFLEAAFQFVSGEFVMVDFTCTDGLKSERHVSNWNDGKESPGQCPIHLGFAELWLFGNLTVCSLSW